MTRSGVSMAKGVLTNRATIGAVLLVALLATVPNSHAQSPQPAFGGEPAWVVTTFYKWVLGTMVDKSSPIKQKRVMATWLSKSL
ncbi:MAG: hypothetical protein R2682_15930, partial [Pyrinomonadaceae bacterium]